MVNRKVKLKKKEEEEENPDDWMRDLTAQQVETIVLDSGKLAFLLSLLFLLLLLMLLLFF